MRAQSMNHKDILKYVILVEACGVESTVVWSSFLIVLLSRENNFLAVQWSLAVKLNQAACKHELWPQMQHKRMLSL